MITCKYHADKLQKHPISWVQKHGKPGELLVEKPKQVRQEIEEVKELIEDVSVEFADYTWLLIPGALTAPNSC
jgi:hypothetical protein